jgi:uncharacterized iron-regulated membrane protein
LAFRTYILNLRKFRKWHKFLGTSLALLLVISALTGILLSLKKEVAIIQPPTTKGINTDLNNWLSIDEIDAIARRALYTAHPEQRQNPIDRLDIRPSKGIAKVLFDKGYWEVQIDGTTGEVKSIARRHSDWIEAVHDGSIISELFKLIAMNVLGIGLLMLITTGLWLWYGPKKIRWLKKKYRGIIIKNK